MTMKILMLCLAVEAITTPFFFLKYALVFNLSQPWGLITYQFSHASWGHLLGNFSFGLPFMLFLESKIGSKALLRFYLICGVGSAMLFFATAGLGASMIGSSGSIFGVAMGACLYFGDNRSERILGLGLLVFLMTVQSFLAANDMLSNTAYWGHIGGGLTGILLYANRPLKLIPIPIRRR